MRYNGRSEAELIVGAVACDPKNRGQHLAADLVRSVCALAESEGRHTVTAAADDGLVAYYERLGFHRIGTLALLTRTDTM